MRFTAWCSISTRVVRPTEKRSPCATCSGRTAENILRAEKCCFSAIVLPSGVGVSNRPPLAEDLPDDVRVMVKKLPDSFLEHETYRIRMDVNPSRIVDGRRRAVPRSELENWLHDKAKRSGFAFTHLQIGRYGTTRFTKEGRRVTFAELRVDGIVRVLDADLFKQTVANGFGRGKAFGYGLMQIITISLQ